MSSVALLQPEVAWPRTSYRANAMKARALSETASDEDARKVLLNDARLWDLMAEYEEQAPTAHKLGWGRLMRSSL